MLGAQSLQRRDDRFLILMHSIGDHTRGLFEAEASIAVSTTHPFEDVEIIILARHIAPPQFAIREKPTFCVVTSSVVASGLPATSTSTRMRTKIRQASPRHWQ